MRIITLILIYISCISATSAQSALPSDNNLQSIVSVDRDLWNNMISALGNISMPLSAHQQVQQIIKEIENESVRRSVRKLQQRQE